MAKTSLSAGQLSGNLNFSTAQKMIHRMLIHDRIKIALDDGRVVNPAINNETEIRLKAYTREELAKKIGITPEELEKLKSTDFYKEMATKISLPLIRLYCSIKFVDGEYKGK